MKVTHERRGSAWMVKGGSWRRRLELQPAVPQPLSLSLSPAPRRRGLSSRAQRAALRTRAGGPLDPSGAVVGGRMRGGEPCHFDSLVHGIIMAEPLCPRASAEVKKGRSILVKIPTHAV